ncbi:MAG TPA: tRNA uridine-5-carboxymethylaminomethyl(34) synthesis GTPase MnmE [Casimicrobiaceae bacterium]|nr:tRNA uridine-5-carboxymethylaminomethyl(34) synthesis GTPase MnmE [Casimicrobiaceae bacterium]
MARPSAQDVIAAIATPPGRGGVGIVRVSGRDVAAVAEGVLGALPPPRTATFATFRGAHGEPLDQGVALRFAAPASFTGEDVLELQGHGSPVGLQLLLARCLALGARLAEPGEFTRRAFLNGKIDLAQAESVADFIEAATATAARAAVRSLSGEFSRAIHALVDGVTRLRMFTEATLDFPDEDIEFVRAADATGQLDALRASLATLLARAATGVRLARGVTLVLVGRPNVGKSSLLNRLVREEAAIVTAIAGTTRDTVERPVEIGGIPLTVVDTAGLREATDEVERLGIERTWAAIARADLALVLVDARDAADALHADDAAMLASLPPALPLLVVHNKADLAGGLPRVERRAGRTHVWLSALTGAGLDLLEHEVLAIAGVASVGEDAFIARERHLAALREAQLHLDEAAAQIRAAHPALELFAESLREAQEALGEVTGEFTADDLLGVIFSRFCIGK